MSTATLYRASGLALLLGAVVFVIGSILSFTSSPVMPLWVAMTGVWISGMILQLLGMPGVVTRQATRAGWLGAGGYLLTFLGWFLLAGFYIVDNLILSSWLNALAPHVYAQWSLNPAVVVTVHMADVLVGVGGLLLGIATLRAGVFLQWTGVLLVVAGLAAFGGFVVGILTTAAVTFVALGLGGMGYVLWTAHGEAATVAHVAPAA